MRVDFLRHIVNPKLAEYSRTRKQLTGVIDELRKMIASAEDKYNFSAFGGEPSNLAKYLNSSDFDLVVNIMKSANALDVLEDILRTTIDKYRENPDIVAAAERRLQELKRGIVRVEETKLIAETISREIKDAEIRYEKDHISIDAGILKAKIVIGKEGYRVILKIDYEREFDTRMDAINFITKVYGLLKGR